MKSSTWPATALVLAASTPAGALAQMPPSSCGDLLIVLDRSGSMEKCVIEGMNKETHAKNALREVAQMYPTVPMGLVVFPNTIDWDRRDGMMTPRGQRCTSECSQGEVVFDVVADGAMRLGQFLNAMPTSCGGTPTGSSMEVARDYSKWEAGRRHYVLLITDGQPTCDDGVDGSGRLNPTSMKCEGGGPGTMCNGGGCCECKNPVRVFNAIDTMRKSGIGTFVVGFEGAATGCTTICTPDGKPFNPATLDEMANQGGLPNRSGGHSYYSATNATSLRDSLRRIVGMVAGGTAGGCGAGGLAEPTPRPAAPGGSGGSGQGGAGGSGGGSGGRPPPSGCACSLGAADAGEDLAGIALALLAVLGSAIVRRRVRGRSPGRQPRALRAG